MRFLSVSQSAIPADITTELRSFRVTREYESSLPNCTMQANVLCLAAVDLVERGIPAYKADLLKSTNENHVGSTDHAFLELRNCHQLHPVNMAKLEICNVFHVHNTIRHAGRGWSVRRIQDIQDIMLNKLSPHKHTHTNTETYKHICT